MDEENLNHPSCWRWVGRVAPLARDGEGLALPPTEGGLFQKMKNVNPNRDVNRGVLPHVKSNQSSLFMEDGRRKFDSLGRSNLAKRGRKETKKEKEFIRNVNHRYAVRMMMESGVFKKEDVITSKLTEIQWERFLQLTM